MLIPRDGVVTSTLRCSALSRCFSRLLCAVFPFSPCFLQSLKQENHSQLKSHPQSFSLGFRAAALDILEAASSHLPDPSWSTATPRPHVPPCSSGVLSLGRGLGVPWAPLCWGSLFLSAVLPKSTPNLPAFLLLLPGPFGALHVLGG